MMNIVSGLIIDSFSIIRDQDQKSVEDKENKCFICGNTRDDIEKTTEKPFKFHVFYEHNEWNYVFFIAYLKYKKKTEFSGIESYVQKLIDDESVDWIPQKKILITLENKNKETKNKELERIHNEIATIRDEIENIITAKQPGTVHNSVF